MKECYTIYLCTSCNSLFKKDELICKNCYNISNSKALPNEPFILDLKEDMIYSLERYYRDLE